MAATQPPSETRLGLASLLALGVNGTVGVGIFFAPREVAAAVPGWLGAWTYPAVALLFLPTAWVFARLGRAFPEDGGPYLYANAAFGAQAAFAVGLTAFVSALFSTATVVVGFVESASVPFGLASPSERLFAELLLVTALTAVLSRGLSLSAATWSTVTVLKAIPLVSLPVAALFVAPVIATAPSAPGGAPSGFLPAALAVAFSLQGFEVVPLPAAHVKDAPRNVPLATVGTLVVAALLYFALHASCVRAVPDLGAHELPLADAARAYGGTTFYRIVLATTTVSALGIVIGMIAMTPRYLAPLGRPEALGFGLDELDLHAVPRRAFAVTFTLLVFILAVNAKWGSMGNLFALSALSVTLQYTVTAAALFVLSARKSRGLSPADRWPAVLAALGAALTMLGATWVEVPIVVALLSFGFLARALRKRTG
ncbi:MAG TPA: APC family permease [Polyangiaceae bacterium]|nr:APC family permease [Polyangiaceae bacterium]